MMTNLNLSADPQGSPVRLIDPLLSVERLNKRYRDGDPLAVEDVNFTLGNGEILALLGPSGCGKTTTLRMIAGFETPDGGEILLHGKRVTQLPPQQRRIGIVFQDYALFPHMSLGENVAFAMRHIAKAKRPAKAREWLDLVGLADLSARMPDELSGGQQQRVALARTLAAEPELVLLDEPFSNLDAALRESTRKEVRRLFKAAGTSVILVTHDQAEALSFADQVGVMHSGRLLQMDRPECIYQTPATSFVAEFLGHTNLLEGEADGEIAQTALGPVAINHHHQGPVRLSLRPEHLSLSAAPDDHGATIVEREFRGHDCYYLLEHHGQRFCAITPSHTLWKIGEQVRLEPQRTATVLRD
ncbi:ABC transporter ATP-binding protein [Halomonas chromatireducens]|uniref:Fe(3+) ions import ATP-binding protein FbpC 2 n=2 Tax=Halomonas TaxID=2745 RepID=A0A109UKY0_9GAMM|nr:ABC transporter ATP-binding protein [Halomonas chromatireducens]AMC99661.1 Fe(3+) ions import ATP-binding protein FbpC 2 [Halomonas chromatireducens]